jgi:hypothetical protein
MEYQNNLLKSENKRIHHILQHKQWLEYAPEAPLDFTELMTDKPMPSWFSQLDETEKQFLNERLAHLELIFRTVSEEEIDKILTDKNSQTLNADYETVRKSRRMTREVQQNFEKVAA